MSHECIRNTLCLKALDNNSQLVDHVISNSEICNQMKKVYLRISKGDVLLGLNKGLATNYINKIEPIPIANARYILPFFIKN